MWKRYLQLVWFYSLLNFGDVRWLPNEFFRRLIKFNTRISSSLLPKLQGRSLEISGILVLTTLPLQRVLTSFTCLGWSGNFLGSCLCICSTSCPTLVSILLPEAYMVLNLWLFINWLSWLTWIKAFNLSSKVGLKDGFSG